MNLRFQIAIAVLQIGFLSAPLGRAAGCGPGAAPEGEFSIDPEIKDEEEEESEIPTYFLFPDQAATLSGTATDEDCHCGHPTSDSFDEPSGHKWTTTAATLSATQGATVTITAPPNEVGSPSEAEITYSGDDKGTPHNDGGFVDFAKNKILFPKFNLVEVTYSGCLEWMKSDDGTVEYSGPHAKDVNGNGTLDDEADRKYPVCYRNSTDVWISAKWKVQGDKKPPAGTKFYVKFSGPGGLQTEDKPTDYNAETGEVTFPKGGAETAYDGKVGTLGATIAAYGATNPGSESFKWSLGVDGSETTHYFPAGENKNVLYCCLGTPPSGMPLLESMVHISCKSAEGKATAGDAFTAIWNEFKDKTVKRLDGHALQYWGPDPGDTYAELLKNGSGKCRAWGELLTAMVRLQGGGGGIRGIKAKEPPSHPANKQDGFFVKRWNFVSISDAPTNVVGIPGQSHDDPASAFKNHIVFEWTDGRLYDPSYGASFADISEWEWKCVDIFLYIGSAGGQIFIQDPAGDQTEHY